MPNDKHVWRIRGKTSMKIMSVNYILVVEPSFICKQEKSDHDENPKGEAQRLGGQHYCGSESRYPGNVQLCRN